jgi:hypothetical protein
MAVLLVTHTALAASYFIRAKMLRYFASRLSQRTVRWLAFWRHEPSNIKPTMSHKLA